MPHNPDYSVQIAAYVAPELRKRMARIAKRNRRFSISRQVECALNAHIDVLEAQASAKAARPAGSVPA